MRGRVVCRYSARGRTRAIHGLGEGGGRGVRRAEPG